MSGRRKCIAQLTNRINALRDPFDFDFDILYFFLAFPFRSQSMTHRRRRTLNLCMVQLLNDVIHFGSTVEKVYGSSLPVLLGVIFKDVQYRLCARVRVGTGRMPCVRIERCVAVLLSSSKPSQSNGFFACLHPKHAIHGTFRGRQAAQSQCSSSTGLKTRFDGLPWPESVPRSPTCQAGLEKKKKKANRDKETPQLAHGHLLPIGVLRGPFVPIHFHSSIVTVYSWKTHTSPGHCQLDIPFPLNNNNNNLPTTTTSTMAVLLTYANPMTAGSLKANVPSVRERERDSGQLTPVLFLSSLLRVSNSSNDTIRYDAPRTGMDDDARTHARCAAPAYQSPLSVLTPPDQNGQTCRHPATGT